MLYAGIDAGSRAIKVVVLDGATLAVVASGMTDQGVAQDTLAGRLLERVLGEAGLGRKRVARIVATGYGRASVSAADTTITEITCHACGVHRELPEAATVIDIGGQDSKLIRLNRDGTVRDFAMNDRCAAGTGRFLEVVARRLEADLGDLGRMAARSTAPVPISSTCVVFAETEIIGLLAAGRTPDDIVAGIQRAVATRVASMAGRNLAEPIAFTGGVALLPGMDRALASALGRVVTVAPNPQMTGALGAAILAARTDGEQA
jgi:predicted CoA-substrate-specific enzyme activase